VVFFLLLSFSVIRNAISLLQGEGIREVYSWKVEAEIGFLKGLK